MTYRYKRLALLIAFAICLLAVSTMASPHRHGAHHHHGAHPDETLSKEAAHTSEHGAHAPHH